MKRFILLLVVVIAVASCKKDLIAYNAVEGKWIQELKLGVDSTTYLGHPIVIDSLDVMTLDFNTKTTGLSNTALGDFKYSLSKGTLEFYGARGSASGFFNITIISSTELTLSQNSGTSGRSTMYFKRVQ